MFVDDVSVGRYTVDAVNCRCVVVVCASVDVIVIVDVVIGDVVIGDVGVVVGGNK